jgi:hypothetical protein
MRVPPAVILILCASKLYSQEARAGFEMPITVTAGGFHAVRGVAPGESDTTSAVNMRAVAYPTLKLSRNWFMSGAVQAISRPNLWGAEGYGLSGDVLQAYLGYGRQGQRGSIVFKAGILQPAFGSFSLRYDDAVNPLIDAPLQYGYYYESISTLGLAGAQVDATLGKADFRAQFTTSSPANRRSIFDSDQYANWTAGAGYTIRQGFRIGASFYRGPYLHRGYRFFRAGEAMPKLLPATGYGIDVQYARGHWAIHAEMQRFQRAYRIVPTVNDLTGYAEFKYTFHPRWYLAGRAGSERWDKLTMPGDDAFEVTVGFRPNRWQLIKMGYQFVRDSRQQGVFDHVFAGQLVTRLDTPSFAWE